MGSTTINSYHYLLLILLTVCGVMGEDEVAVSDRLDTSVCINIYECKSLINILNNATKPLSQSIKQYMRNIHCGYDGTQPKVRCEKQTAETETKDPPDVSGHVNLRLINSVMCGLKEESRIIYGGTKTGVFEYPWMALLAYRTPGERQLGFKCGGTVINERYILTAAHCVVESPGVLESVRVGEHTISTEEDCILNEYGEKDICAEKYQDINVASTHPHPDYLPRNTANDIALVRLSRDMDLKPKNVKPICLPVGSAFTPATKKVTVTGWGVTEDGEQSDTLLQINIPQVSNEDCAKVYRYNTQITHKQLCAGGRSGISVCNADSGGPLQVLIRYHNTAKMVQYGIVSFGLESCASEGIPGVYTNVKYYMDWILNTIKS